jgi:hypothetical protein
MEQMVRQAQLDQQDLRALQVRLERLGLRGQPVWG